MQAGCRHNQKEKCTVSSKDDNGYECYLWTLKDEGNAGHKYFFFFTNIYIYANVIE